MIWRCSYGILQKKRDLRIELSQGKWGWGTLLENVGQSININLITSFLFFNIPYHKSAHLLTPTPLTHFTPSILISDHRM